MQSDTIYILPKTCTHKRNSITGAALRLLPPFISYTDSGTSALVFGEYSSIGMAPSLSRLPLLSNFDETPPTLPTLLNRRARPGCSLDCFPPSPNCSSVDRTLSTPSLPARGAYGMKSSAYGCLRCWEWPGPLMAMHWASVCV
jgi:hypothetical protein